MAVSHCVTRARCGKERENELKNDLPELAHLRRPLRLALLGLWAKRIVRGFWPVWSIGFFSCGLWLFGALDLLPELWRLAVLWVLGLAAVAALVRGVIGWRRPSLADAVAALDQSHSDRPLAALVDTPVLAGGDAGTDALWQAHRQRMLVRSRTLRAEWPDLSVAADDPFGLRYAALLLFVVALLFAPRDARAPIAGGAVADIPDAVWEGWIEPPAYTGRPALYLADQQGGEISVPIGSRVTVRFYGAEGALNLRETVSSAGVDAQEMTYRLEVDRSGLVEIDGADNARWQVSAVPDVIPEIALDGPLETDASGRMQQPFKAEDDYGVTQGAARFVLDVDQVTRQHGKAIAPEERAPIVVDLPMPIRGGREQVSEVLLEDFSKHPYANLPVSLEMQIEDALAQTGDTVPVAMILPGRRFFEPVARAVIEQRSDLLWNRANAPRVAQILRAISHRPEESFGNETAYLRLRVAIRHLEALEPVAADDEQVSEIADMLWEVAVELEEGRLADARERLRRAQERLAEAMRNGASEAEIAELMDELRDAIDDYTRMLAEQQPQEQGEDGQQQEGESRELSGDQLQAMMDRIQELMEQGRMEEAQQMMQALNELLENLRVTQSEGEGSQGQQSMQDLGETLREQQELSDEAFQDLQERYNGQEQQGGEQGQPQGENGTGSGGAEAGPDGREAGRSLADRQQALREELERQRGGLPLLEGEAAERAERSLERAEGAMDGAEEALREGRLAEALDNQAEAMEALRDGLRNLGQALADNREMDGQGGQQGGATATEDQNRSDPLGRDIGRLGQQGTDEQMLGDGISEDERAAEILRELRDRAGDRSRSEDEQEYLKRLLEQF
ncbi:TIGR02302 family protein [Pelagovum sp. HNIBRBA483]|uniref:TIGR02302 family protein n=1 Tax=Pelagovum sp. HNIBRBA483 TaxID=3233341 RepID=UPI0034A564B7